MSKKKLRVLYLLLFPFYGSGSGTYARYLAMEVNKKHDVAVVTPDTRPIDGVKLYPLGMPFRAAFTGHPEWPNCKLFTDLTNIEILKFHKAYMDSAVAAIEDFKPDIVHVHHAFPLSWAARFIKSTYNIPYVITVHGSELPTGQKDQRYLALTSDALRKAQRIFPNSDYTKEWCSSVFGSEFNRNMSMIPGGVDTAKFHRVPTTNIDKEYDLKDKKVVLFSGKLTKYKGVKYLVKAARKMKAEVLILGDGPERKELVKIAKDYNIQNIHFLGHIKDDTEKLVQLYSRADVLAAPSVWDEPLGLVILEAMACETPVVVTRKGGIPLAVKEGKNGLFVKQRRIIDLADKVNCLLADDERRKVMGKAAREIAVNKFSWERIASEFISFYEKYANS